MDADINLEIYMFNYENEESFLILTEEDMSSNNSFFLNEYYETLADETLQGNFKI